MQSETNVTIIMTPEEKKGLFDILRGTWECLKHEKTTWFLSSLVSGFICMVLFSRPSVFYLLVIAFVGFKASMLGGALGLFWFKVIKNHYNDKNEKSCNSVINMKS